jgi:hypothetical protein
VQGSDIQQQIAWALAQGRRIRVQIAARIERALGRRKPQSR